MKEKGINMIVVSDLLLKDTRFKNDEEWQFFLTHYETFDYTKIAVDGTTRYILIKNILL